jgi:hypothetical protein
VYLTDLGDLTPDDVNALEPRRMNDEDYLAPFAMVGTPKKRHAEIATTFLAPIADVLRRHAFQRTSTRRSDERDRRREGYQELSHLFGLTAFSSSFQ